MRYFNNINEFDKNKGSVVTVGKFEGLHNGHRTLFNAVINEAKENNLTSFVYTFDDEIFKKYLSELLHATVITSFLSLYRIPFYYCTRIYLLILYHFQL